MNTLQTTDPAPTPAQAVGKLLDQLSAYLNRHTRSSRIKTAPLTVAIAQWKAALPGNPTALRQLLDTDTIPALAAVRRPGGAGLAFFVPVVLAWAFLAAMEWSYSLAGTKESFFYWWSTQPFGPFVYSGVIAVLLSVILLVQLGVQAQQRAADQIEDELQHYGVQLGVAVAALTPVQQDDSGQLLMAAGSLAAAGDRLGHAAAAMTFDRSSFDRYVAAADRAERAVERLADTTQALAAQVSALSVTLDELPAAVAEVEQKLDPARKVAVSLEAAAFQARQQSQNVKADLDRLASEILPQATRLGADAAAAASEANRSVPRVLELADSLHKALTAIKENQERSAELLDKAFRLHAWLDEGGSVGPAA